MKLIGFKTPKPRQFNYKPKFYDQEKEELEKKVRSSGLAENGDPDVQKMRIRMQESWKIKEKQEKKRTGIRNLMIALFLIILLIYFIFFI